MISQYFYQQELLILSLKSVINLPNKITITHTEQNTSHIRNTATGTCPTII
jgi:hypothetical protein